MADTSSTPVWSNWSGRHHTLAGQVHHLRSEADAAALAAAASAAGNTLRVAGAGHSHMPLVPTDGVIADMSGLSGVISTDPKSQRAWVWAGTPIYALGRPLADAGLALFNQGDIDRQLIGGAIATGTHGTGAELQNLSASVLGARVALASGELVDCSPATNTSLWEAMRLNLGALGIVTRLALQLRPAYRLRERRAVISYGELAPQLDDLVTENRHFEFFWYPTKDRAVLKTIEETTAPPRYPLAPEGSRLGWSFEVLPNHRTWRHTEMEYSVPAEDGPACLDEIRDMLREKFPSMGWPVEYRTVAADEVWLSTAYRRPTVTISLHQDVDEDDEPLYRAAEEIFRAFDGRPHWGKVNYLDGDELADIHPRWSDWWSVRDAVDPGGVFLNDYLDRIRP
jgi:FAD/FMN-containing dehydrogenase